jgi:hypothetical protein
MLLERLELIKNKTNNPNVVNHLNRRILLGVDEKNCCYFIKRKNRFCTHRAAAGNFEEGKCTEHSALGIFYSFKFKLLTNKRILVV